MEGARMTATKERLPNRRCSQTVKVKIDGMSVYLTTGEYGDGRLGEIFIDVEKQGSLARAMLNAFAISVSKGLQHGIPLEEYTDEFLFYRFGHGGVVQGHDKIASCSSILDFVFRELAIRYLKRSDLIQKGKTATPISGVLDE